VTSSRGIVIFAYNTEYDYVKIANVCAALTKRFRIFNAPLLDITSPIIAGLPVTLITDTFGALQADQNYFDNIIIHSTDEKNKRGFRTTHDESVKKVMWKNLTRADVYELTPYDQTLLLDCDYLMFNNKLLNLFNSDVEFTCYRHVHDMTGTNTFQGDSRLSQYSIPMLWATAIYFRKSTFSKSVFDMMKIVKENYHYYAKVYGFNPYPFRNDFALSIAYHAMSGYGLDELLTQKLLTLSTTVDVIDFRRDGSLIYQYKTADQKLYTGYSHAADLHVMNKEIFTDEIVNGMLEYAQT
jgi:hypothetical protein